MLKLHEFECTVCHHVQEELLDVPPQAAHIHCNKCRGVSNHVVIGGRSHVFRDFWHPHLDHKPIRITSWRQYKQELRSRGLDNELGS